MGLKGMKNPLLEPFNPADILGDLPFMFMEINAFCDCPARYTVGMQHWYTCAVSPIYADLHNDHDPRRAFNEIDTANLSRVRRVYRCHLCGKKNVADNMLTITDADTMQIVKNVCAKHSVFGRTRIVNGS